MFGILSTFILWGSVGPENIKSYWSGLSATYLNKGMLQKNLEVLHVNGTAPCVAAPLDPPFEHFHDWWLHLTRVLEKHIHPAHTVFPRLNAGVGAIWGPPRYGAPPVK